MMRKKSVSLLVFFLVCMLLPPGVYARKKRAPRIDCPKRLSRAIEKIEKKRYGRAHEILTDIKFKCAGHEVMDSIVYFTGKALLGMNRPSEASVEFEQLIRDFGNSKFFIESHYHIGLCSYLTARDFERDQAETRTAIREFSDFLQRFPESTFADSAKKYLRLCTERLAKKEFMNARFYETIDEHEAAVIYFDDLIEGFPDSKYVPDAKIAMASNLIKVNRYSEAKTILEEILADTVNISIDIRQQARTIHTRLDRKE